MGEKKFYRINEQIKAQRLRVINNEGKQIGVLSINEALEEARKQNLDLVEIAPTATPPVAKIIDFKKFLYLEEKKEKKSKKGTGGELKEIRMSPFIADKDLEFRIQKAEKFLKEGNKLKITVRFLGRHLNKRDFGYSLLEKVKEKLAEIAKPEGESKWLGRDLILFFSPLKGLSESKEK